MASAKDESIAAAISFQSQTDFERVQITRGIKKAKQHLQQSAGSGHSSRSFKHPSRLHKFLDDSTLDDVSRFKKRERRNRRRSLTTDDLDTTNATMMDELRTLYDHRAKQNHSEHTLKEDTVTEDHMYTDVALLQRESIRLSDKVRKLLTLLYALFDEDGDEKLFKDEYLLLFKKIYFALRAFWDKSLPTMTEQESRAVAEEDWEVDCQGYVVT